MPQEGQGAQQVGEAELPAAVRGLRAGGGGEASRDGVQLQLQVPLVLCCALRAVPQTGHQVLLCPQGEAGAERRWQSQPQAQEKALTFFCSFTVLSAPLLSCPSHQLLAPLLFGIVLSHSHCCLTGVWARQKSLV